MPILSLSVLSVASRAHAAMMEHTDLTSLALEADAVVRGHMVASRRTDHDTVRNTIEVSRAFKGPLTVGATLELTYDSYTTTKLFGDAPDTQHVLGPELIFFVAAPPPAETRRRGEWSLLSSGLRIILDGKAYRFEQWNNPGGFDAVPQRHDPFDIFDDARAGAQLDLPGLESEVERAVTKAQDIASTLAMPTSATRTTKLLRLIGAEPSDSPAGSSLGGFYTDWAGQRIVADLARSNELLPVLRALVRSPGALGSALRLPLEPGAVFDAVANPQLGVPERRAAIRILDALWFELRRDETAEARTIALYDDPAPEIRKDILRLQPRAEPSAAQKAAIASRWGDESDDGVRLALLQAARESNVQLPLDAVRARLPIVVATRTRDVVRVTWGDLDAHANWMVGRASRLELTGTQGKRSVDPFAEPIGYTNGASGYFQVRIPPRREPIAEAVTLHVVLEDDAARPHPPVARTFELGSFTQVLPDPTAVDAVTPTDRPADGPTAVPVPTESRCRCATPGAGEPPRRWVVGLAALLAVRSRRRTTKSR